MKQTNFSRTVSVILGTVLLLLTMLSALSGCGQKPDDTTSTTTTGTQGDAATTANTATDTEAVTTTAPHSYPFTSSQLLRDSFLHTWPTGRSMPT
ncbi:MAG: hypothetical protein J6W14_01875 [Clostridia bacterium]|nr:hypothetical protein [Clostridia bacterium]